ncbi:hypothetical protein PSZ75_23815, partial [Shigella sonnei]|nr:hypothetical protein [Shigella sonnei]
AWLLAAACQKSTVLADGWHITESRLTDICRRFANRPPKRLIFAPHPLGFSQLPVKNQPFWRTVGISPNHAS